MPNMYERIGWKNHVVQYPLRRTIDDNADGTYTVSPSPGEIIQQGTKQSAENFNHMDDGIFDIALAQKIYLQCDKMESERNDLIVSTDDDCKDYFTDEEAPPDRDSEIATDDDIRDLFRR